MFMFPCWACFDNPFCDSIESNKQLNDHFSVKRPLQYTGCWPLFTYKVDQVGLRWLQELLDHLEGMLSNEAVVVTVGQAIVEVKPQASAEMYEAYVSCCTSNYLCTPMCTLR